MESDEHATGKPKKRGDSSGLTVDLKTDLSDINDLLRSAQSPDASEADTIPTRMPREKDGYSLLPARLPTEALKPIGDPAGSLTEEDLRLINTRRGLFLLLRNRNVDLQDVRKRLLYEHELEQLQVELVKLQRWVQRTGERIAILVEGRDAAGKGGTIRRFTEHLNPRAMRVVALPKPTDEERGQWYFQRYIRQLPNRGEIVFFDRSWYNRAVVEPVMGFCTKKEHQRFLQQVPEFEHMLYEDGVILVKFWFSISKDEQAKRFEARRRNPLKQWKLSPVDEKAQELWDAYTRCKEEMFSKTHTTFSPWIIVKANDKQAARLESLRYVLNLLPYQGKEDARVRLAPDPNVVVRFHRKMVELDF
ncbi:MAG: polyphosphate kinase 2 [Nitrospira sp.]|nr:polyphosphate kinase 2 [Nitrospira sp.]